MAAGKAATANGVKLYYEVHGKGQPLVLLHGGLKDAGWDGSGIPQSRLAILPGATHYDILASPLLPPVVTAFLDARLPAGSEK